MKDSLKRFSIKSFMFNDKCQNLHGLTEFVGKSPTSYCAKRLQ